MPLNNYNKQKKKNANSKKHIKHANIQTTLMAIIGRYLVKPSTAPLSTVKLTFCSA